MDKIPVASFGVIKYHDDSYSFRYENLGPKQICALLLDVVKYLVVQSGEEPDENPPEEKEKNESPPGI